MTLERGTPQSDYWQDGARFRPSSHPIPRFFARQRVAFLAHHVEFAPGETVLDVGCGDGLSTSQMPAHLCAFGVDSSAAMLRRGAVARACVADVKHLPYPDASFDYVNGWEVLHHDPHPEALVSEMARVARRHVILFEPNRYNPGQVLLALLESEHRLVLRYAPAYLRSVVESAGLRVEWQAQIGWIFPNKTPAWLFPLLKRLPFSWPLGISTLVIGSR